MGDKSLESGCNPPQNPQIYPHFPLLNILRGIEEGIQCGGAVCAPLPARCQTNGVANQSGFSFTNSFGESEMDLEWLGGGFQAYFLFTDFSSNC